jgi:hypothetical protein
VIVTALLRRHGVEPRLVGLTPTEIPAASLYGRGWSLARLGEAFDVDASTVGGRCELPVWLCGLRDTSIGGDTPPRQRKESSESSSGGHVLFRAH